MAYVAQTSKAPTFDGLLALLISTCYFKWLKIKCGKMLRKRKRNAKWPTGII